MNPVVLISFETGPLAITFSLGITHINGKNFREKVAATVGISIST